LRNGGKLLGDVSNASAILDRSHHAQIIAIMGRSYRLKDQAAVAGKELKHNKAETLTAGSASQG
jgi:hypothetical protein